MGELIFFPGCEPKINHMQILENMITSILNHISDIHIESRTEMGSIKLWSEEVRQFIINRDIPCDATPGSLVSALRDYKEYWRQETLKRIDLFNR